MRTLYETLLDDTNGQIDKLDNNAINGFICKYFKAPNDNKLKYSFRNGNLYIDNHFIQYESADSIREVLPFVKSVNCKGNKVVNVLCDDADLFVNCSELNLVSRRSNDVKVKIKKEQRIGVLFIEAPYGNLIQSLSIDVDLRLPAGVVLDYTTLWLPQFPADNLAKCKSTCEKIWFGNNCSMSDIIKDLIHRHQDKRQILTMDMKSPIDQDELDAYIPIKNFPNLTVIQYGTYMGLKKQDDGTWIKSAV